MLERVMNHEQASQEEVLYGMRLMHATMLQLGNEEKFNMKDIHELFLDSEDQACQESREVSTRNTTITDIDNKVPVAFPATEKGYELRTGLA